MGILDNAQKIQALKTLELLKIIDDNLNGKPYVRPTLAKRIRWKYNMVCERLHNAWLALKGYEIDDGRY